MIIIFVLPIYNYLYKKNNNKKEKWKSIPIFY